jgi:hypothetical protein
VGLISVRFVIDREARPSGRPEPKAKGLPTRAFPSCCGRANQASLLVEDFRKRNRSQARLQVEDAESAHMGRRLNSRSITRPIAGAEKPVAVVMDKVLGKFSDPDLGVPSDLAYVAAKFCHVGKR